MYLNEVSRLYKEFPVELPTVSAYTVLGMTLAAITCWIAVLSFRQNRNVWMRSAFQFGAMVAIIFQWPLVFFFDILKTELERPWLFATAIHGFTLVCFLWVFLTPQFTSKIEIDKGQSRRTSGTAMYVQLSVSLLVFYILASLYLRHVGFECTGLYAFLFDSELTLVARDLSVKFVKDPLASYAIALNIGAVGPIALVAVGVFFTQMIKTRNLLGAAAAFVVSLGILFVTMVNSAKGNVLPALVVGTIVLLIRCEGWKKRLLSIFALFVLSLSIMLGLEIGKEISLPTERSASKKSASLYPLGACLVRVNACQEGARLIRFFERSSGYVGVPSSRVPYLRRDVEMHCPLEFIGEVEDDSWWPEGEYADSRVVREARPSFDRIVLYAGSIARRILIVPIQIASWHFQYADEFGSPGLRYLPVVSNFFGGRIGDMPSRVHDAYLTIYSNSSTIPSGTSPTSFLVSAPAYLGYWGFVLAVVLLLIFDISSASLLRYLRGDMQAVAIAILAVAHMNLLLTEFWTAMVSHGAIAGLCLLGIISYLIGKYETRKA